MSEFLAEAAVLIRPDTTKFRALLAAELKSIQAKLPPVVVPVVAAGAASKQAAAGLVAANKSVAASGAAATTVLGKQANAQRALGVTSVSAGAAQANLVRVQELLLSSAAKFAGVETAASLTTGNLAAKRAILREVTAAAALSEKSFKAAIATGQPALVAAQISAVALARATKGLAVADVQAAIAEAELGKAAAVRAAAQSKAALSSAAAATAQARSQSQLTRGAVASTLSLGGVRGATLAASGAFLAGAAAVVVFAKAIGLTASFERELNVFQATAGATAEQMTRVAEAANRLGADITLPAVSAADAAEAMTELAKAGLSVQDAIDGARGVLQLATAANISNAEATELAASALNAFGLAGTDAERVADVLANSANEAQGSIVTMGLALQQVAAVGRLVGFSLEDTATQLTILARAGLKGSDAGTSLRTAFIRLINPTKEASALIEKLGVDLRDAEGNLRPDVFVNLGIALRGYTKAERDATLATIGGQDALRALSIASRQTIDELIAARKAQREQGTAAEIAAARTKGLAGAGQALASTLETVGISIGKTVTPALTDLVNNVTAATLAISQSAQVQETLSGTLGLVGSAFSTLGQSIALVGPPLLGVAGMFQQVVAAVGVTEILAGAAAYRILPALLLGVGGAAGKLALAFRAAATAAATFQASVAIGGVLSTARLGLSALTASLATFATSVTGVGLAAAVLAGGLVFLATRETAGERATRHLTESTNALAEALTAANQATRGLASAQASVKTDEIAVQTARLAAEQARQALASSDAAEGSFARRQLENQLLIALDNVVGAEERLGTARREAREQQDTNAQAARNLADARKQDVAALQELFDAEKARARLVSQTDAGPELAAADALRRTIDALREKAAVQREANTTESRDLAKRYELLAKLQEQSRQLATPTTMRILLNADSARAGLVEIAKESGIKGKEAIDNFVQAMLLGIAPLGTRITASVTTALEGLANIFKNAGVESGKKFKEGVGQGLDEGKPLTAKQLLGQAAGTEERLLDIQFEGGSRADEIPALQKLLDQKIAAIAALKPSATEARRRLKGERNAVLDEIESIEKELKSDAEQRKGKIEKARDDAFQAMSDALGDNVAGAEARLQLAQGTERLGDDFKAFANLKNKIKAAIAKLRKEGKEALDEIADYEAQLKQIAQDAKALRAKADAERKEEQKEARRNALQKREDILNIDSQLAELSGNESAQRKALQAEIDFYKKRIDATRKGSLQRKEWILKLRQAQAELGELKKEKDKTSNAFNEQVFSSLQTQQGFAANLLGNLLDPGATAGTVGGTAPPVSAPTPAAGLVQRKTEKDLGPSGPTRGGQTTEIDLLRQILHALQDVRRGTGHPEAKYNKMTTREALNLLGD